MSKELQEAIAKLAGTHLMDLVSLVPCTVTAVDEDEQTCDVSTIGGNGSSDIPGVNLSMNPNDTFLLIPEVGSTVMVAASTRNNYFVCLYSDLSKVKIIVAKTQIIMKTSGLEFNDASFGGIVKINDLKSQWDANVTALKAAIVVALGVIDTQLIALGQAGGSVAAFNSQAGAIQNLTLGTLENNEVKHGTL